MRRWWNRGILVLSAAVGTPLLLHSQSAQPSEGKAPAFEVASVKANTSGDGRGGGRILPGGRVIFTNESLRAVIRDAYGQNDVLGGPSWVDSDKWDIVATAPPGQPDAPTRLMMQTLLAERFKVAAHVEQQEQPIYALVVSSSDKRLGSRMHQSVRDCPITVNTCGTQSSIGQIIGNAALLDDMTRTLSRLTGRRVIDRTALTGRFDFRLTWTPDTLPPRAPGTSPDQPITVNGVSIDPNGPTLVTALQEQLGLKLESTKGPVDVLMIDHVERPTPD
jgi:uncharacterized protein (TIGR03435 family)